jgi:hypothetical protein
MQKAKSSNSSCAAKKESEDLDISPGERKILRQISIEETF